MSTIAKLARRRMKRATKGLILAFVYYGHRYREKPQPEGQASECDGCAFYDDPDGCIDAGPRSEEAFGGDCRVRRVIYVMLQE